MECGHHYSLARHRPTTTCWCQTVHVAIPSRSRPTGFSLSKNTDRLFFGWRQGGNSDRSSERHSTEIDPVTSYWFFSKTCDMIQHYLRWWIPSGYPQTAGKEVKRKQKRPTFKNSRGQIDSLFVCVELCAWFKRSNTTESRRKRMWGREKKRKQTKTKDK